MYTQNRNTSPEENFSNRIVNSDVCYPVSFPMMAATCQSDALIPAGCISEFTDPCFQSCGGGMKELEQPRVPTVPTCFVSWIPAPGSEHPADTQTTTS